VHLITRGHFRSRDKDGDHTIRHRRKRHAARKLYGSVFYRTVVRPITNRRLHCWNRKFRPCLLMWPWTWPDDLHIRIWPVF